MSPEKFEEWLVLNRCMLDGLFTSKSVRELYALLTPRWVPVEERLPEDGEFKRVALTYPSGERGEDTLWYDNDNKQWADTGGHDADYAVVTHWLDHYIPRLPEVEG